jgi:hypothetical protein
MNGANSRILTTRGENDLPRNDYLSRAKRARYTIFYAYEALLKSLELRKVEKQRVP